MVGELSLDAGDRDVINAVVVQHLLGDLGSGESTRRKHFRVLGENTFQAPLDDKSDKSDDDNQNPTDIHINYVLIVNGAKVMYFFGLFSEKFSQGKVFSLPLTIILLQNVYSILSFVSDHHGRHGSGGVCKPVFRGCRLRKVL